MSVFYDTSQLTTGDLEYEIRQLSIALAAKRELIALGLIDDTVSGNKKYLTDKVKQLTNQRDSFLTILQRWDALFPGDHTGSPHFVQLIIDTRVAVAAAKE